jgi:glutamate-5-semialdehyde dehydrogenase
MGKKAREAARVLANAGGETRAGALRAMADALERSADSILRENALDVESGRVSGLSPALLDRLALNPARITGMAQGLRSVSALPDPLGRLLWETERPNGLSIKKISVPLGVVAVIYEARPNVTADSAGLCVMSGNACILRGGSEALRSNLAIAQALREALAASGLPKDCVQLVSDPSRERAAELMRLTEYVDLLIPRGGKGLIDSVVQNARVPVLRTGEGVCHIYVDKGADFSMAAEIIHNAKTSRPSVCNAAECILIHQDIAEVALPEIAARLLQSGVTIHGDEATLEIVPQAVPATEDDWGREYLSLDIACRVVRDMDEALKHIRDYGTNHSEAIITENTETAARFLREVDAAAVYHNASTRFTDGGEFGFGAEIGISTQKLHARGPTGLDELTSYKYVVRGNGQVR